MKSFILKCLEDQATQFMKFQQKDLNQPYQSFLSLLLENYFILITYNFLIKVLKDTQFPKY